MQAGYNTRLRTTTLRATTGTAGRTTTTGLAGTTTTRGLAATTTLRAGVRTTTLVCASAVKATPALMAINKMIFFMVL
jgi:hypothetical protein